MNFALLPKAGDNGHMKYALGKSYLGYFRTFSNNPVYRGSKSLNAR